MPKIDIETLKFILQRNEPDVRKVNAVMEEINMELKAEEEEKANRPPPVKKQFSIILSDPEGELAEKDIVGWVVQVPEDDPVNIAPSKIIQAAYEFNTTPKGRRMPVETIGEACEAVSAKLLKEQNVWIKTKVPVLAVPVANKIPTDESE
ncbi:MAG: hypothetical protein ACSHYA_07015 [Opitutaceae bacterium]